MDNKEKTWKMLGPTAAMSWRLNPKPGHRGSMHRLCPLPRASPGKLRSGTRTSPGFLRAEGWEINALHARTSVLWVRREGQTAGPCAPGSGARCCCGGRSGAALVPGEVNPPLLCLTGQGATGTNWNRGSSSWTRGRTSSPWGWWSPGPGCPGRLWSLLLWRYSRPAWTWCCAACSGWPCLGRGLGWVTHRGPCQPRPVCDSVILWTHIITLASSMKSSSYIAPSRIALMATLYCALHFPRRTTPNKPLPSSLMKVSSEGLISHFSVKQSKRKPMATVLGNVPNW